jgi:uncharacterized repeat protein (TIGR02543 family)
MRRPISRILQLFLLTTVIFALFSCKGLFGTLDNVKDPNSVDYQGYETVTDADSIQTYSPATDAKLSETPATFIVSEVKGASAYQIQISTSNSEFEGDIVFDKSDYTSNKMSGSLPSLTQGIQYYWRSRAKKDGTWGKWTKVASLILGYRISYEGNGNTDGSAPTDSDAYFQGDTATASARPEGFEKAGYGFDGWNTSADGSGTDYAPGVSIGIGTSNITLYAKWHVLSMWATGFNARGQLGDGTNTDRLTPVKVMENVKAVAAGELHTMILKNDDSLWGSGQNGDGQLGDGTGTDHSTPVKVMENVKAVAAGELYTMILKNDGSLWATGFNGRGQLGDGTTTNQLSPVKVMENVDAVAVGELHTMILKNDGSLWATGFNGRGQLGDGTTTDKMTPVKVMENVKTVATKYYHTMILKNDYSLWATGSNSDGQLGDGTTTGESTPVKVMENVEGVAAGNWHTLILK